MKLEDIKIESIKKINNIPKGSSGIAYCENIQLFIEFNNHLSKTILLPDWYTDLSTQIKDFKIEMSSMLTLSYYVIINDRIDFIEEQKKHFVYVDPIWGITDEHV